MEFWNYPTTKPSTIRQRTAPLHGHRNKFCPTLKSLRHPTHWFAKEQATADRRHSAWRPPLEAIYEDPQLMDALTRFAATRFCAENILFLQRVHGLNAMIEGVAIVAMSPFLAMDRLEDDQLHSSILHRLHGAMLDLYSAFIADSAPQQINLRHAVQSRMRSVFGARPDVLSALTLYQKRHLFDECIAEIEQLVNTSVLPLFYSSPELRVLRREWGMAAESASFGKAPRTTPKMRSVPLAAKLQIGAPPDHGIWGRRRSLSAPSSGEPKHSEAAHSFFAAPSDDDDDSKSVEAAHSALSSPSQSPTPSTVSRQSFASLRSLPQSDTVLSGDVSSEEFEAAPALRTVGHHGGASSDSMDALPIEEHSASRFIAQPLESGTVRRVRFGEMAVDRNGRSVLFDRHGVGRGVKEWEIEITAMDAAHSVEIGVAATERLRSLSAHCGPAEGAKAVIGHQPAASGNAVASTYYGSWNEDGKRRCFRALSPKLRAFAVGDILRVRVDAKRNKIRFFLNGEKVRSALSLQCGKTYHPWIAFAGHFRFKLLRRGPPGGQ